MLNKKLLFTLLFCITLFFTTIFSTSSLAQNSVSVTARIPDEIPPTTPILIAPVNGSIISENQPSFIFKQSTDAQSPVRHYEMYLNNNLFIPEIPSSQTPVETGQFYCTISNGTILVKLKDILDDGVYTWKIRAYDMYGNWSDSATWTFTVDTTPPFVIITTIGENNNLNLSSENLQVFSPKPTITSELLQPKIGGRSEPGAKIQISLNLVSGSQQLNLTLNGLVDEDGKFSFIPETQLFPGIYNVTVIAIDAALNTTVLPEFFLEIVFKQIEVSPAPTIPIPPFPPEIITKPEVILQLPQATPFVPWYYQTIPYLTLLLLLLWLITSKFAYGFSLLLTGKYLWLYLIPPIFRRKKISLTFDKANNKVLSFVTITIFAIKENTTKKVKEFLTDQKGKFNLRLKLGSFKLSALHFGFKQTWENLSIPIETNLALCTPLFLDPERYRKYKFYHNTARIFLWLAFFVSIFSLIFWPNLLTLLIFVVCLDLIICFLL